MVFLDNLATLDLPSSSSPFSSKEVFERKSRILPNSKIGRHLKYVATNASFSYDFRHVEGRMAKILNTVESANMDPLSYEGGKRTVGTTEKVFELTLG